MEESVDRRKTAYNLAVSNRTKANDVNDLSLAFRRRLAKSVNEPNYKGPVRRETIAAINRRRDTVVRRKSMAVGQMGVQRPVYDNPGFVDVEYDNVIDSVI